VQLEGKVSDGRPSRPKFGHEQVYRGDLSVAKRTSERSARKCRGLGGEAEAGEQAAGEVGIGDEGHDGAATAAGALENVLGEHPAQELGPWQPARARHGGRAARGKRVTTASTTSSATTRSAPPRPPRHRGRAPAPPHRGRASGPRPPRRAGHRGLAHDYRDHPSALVELQACQQKHATERTDPTCG